MGDILVPFIFQNIMIFCAIFWALTITGNLFYKRKEHTSKKQFYECGFKSLTDSNVTISINFVILSIFLVLYDIEFTLMFPVLFNLSLTCFYQISIFYIFLILVMASIYYDWQLNALAWQY